MFSKEKLGERLRGNLVCSGNRGWPKSIQYDIVGESDSYEMCKDAMKSRDVRRKIMPDYNALRPNCGPATMALNRLLETGDEELNWKCEIHDSPYEELISAPLVFPILGWDEDTLCNPNQRNPLACSTPREPTKPFPVDGDYYSVTSYPYNKTRIRKECIASSPIVPPRKRRCHGLVRSMRCLSELNSLSLEYSISTSSCNVEKLIHHPLPPKVPPQPTIRNSCASSNICSIRLHELHIWKSIYSSLVSVQYCNYAVVYTALLAR